MRNHREEIELALAGGAPHCDVSVAEARAAWPGKRLWINFLSSVHI